MSTLKLTSGGDYVYWLIPGILAQSAVFGSAPTAYGLNNDITKSVLDRSLPMARSAVLAGRTLPDLVRSTFILSLQLAVGILLGFRCHNGITGLLAAMAVALAFGYACSWLMAYIGLIIRNSEAIQAAIYMVVIPMTLTSSYSCPPRPCPAGYKPWPNTNPSPSSRTPSADLLSAKRHYPPATLSPAKPLLALAWTAGILALFVPLAIRAYGRNR
jgi:ABC-type multidrug transport system permease subunit